MSPSRLAAAVLLVMALGHCTGLATGPADALDAGAGVVDAGLVSSPDAAVFVDSGTADAGSRDAGSPDAGQPRDASCPAAPPFDLAVAAAHNCLEPLLLATGDRTRRIVSFDGTEWLNDQIDDGNIVNGQALDDGALGADFGLGYLVIASDFGIFTSADRGHTWVKAPPPAPQQWGQGVHVSPVVYTGRVFSVFSENTTFTSSDAYTWQKHEVTTFSGSHIAFFGVALGAQHRIVVSGGSGGVNVSDDDGLTWRLVDLGLAAPLTSLLYANGVFVGVSKATRISSTDNGDTWQVVHDDCTANDPTLCMGDAPSALTFRDGGFVFTTSASAILESTNGRDWAKTGSGFGFDWDHVYFNGFDYAVHGNNSFWKSASPGGPWPTTDFPATHSQFGIGKIVVTQVLKR